MNRSSFRYALFFAAAVLLAAPLFGVFATECAHGCSCGIRLTSGPSDDAALRLPAASVPQAAEQPSLVSSISQRVSLPDAGRHAAAPLRTLRI